FLNGRPPPSLCATLAISRDTRKSGATNGFGWQNITTCPASPAQPRLSSSATSLEAPRPSVSAPAASCCRIIRLSSSPNNSGRSLRSTQTVSISDWAALLGQISPLLAPFGATSPLRSEEHTSELQSRGHLVCRLLLEK